MTTLPAIPAIDPDVEKFLDSYAYINCRRIGHAWPRNTGKWVVEGVGAQRIYTMRLECSDCGMIRIDRTNVRWESLHPVYERPTDYGVQPGMVLARSDVRRWQIQHALFEVTPVPKPARSRKRAPAAEPSPPARRKTPATKVAR